MFYKKNTDWRRYWLCTKCIRVLTLLNESILLGRIVAAARVASSETIPKAVRVYMYKFIMAARKYYVYTQNVKSGRCVSFVSFFLWINSFCKIRAFSLDQALPHLRSAGTKTDIRWRALTQIRGTSPWRWRNRLTTRASSETNMEPSSTPHSCRLTVSVIVCVRVCFV